MKITKANFHRVLLNLMLLLTAFRERAAGQLASQTREQDSIICVTAMDKDQHFVNTLSREDLPSLKTERQWKSLVSRELSTSQPRSRFL